MIQHWDLIVFHAVNGWCGNWALDRVVFYQQQNQLLQGGIILACYWWFWFAAPEPRRAENRQRIIAAFIGVFLALLVSRILAEVLPFRVRPMYVAGIGYHAPSLQFPMDLENWSSFPSDNAAYFLGLAFGIYQLSRRLGILLMIYATVWICLPRLYLGIHYPSDLVVGAIIGLASVGASTALLTRPTGLAARVMQPINRIEQRHPQKFYAGAFILSFEMSMIFDDVRNFLRSVLHGFHMAGFVAMREEFVLLLLVGLLTCVGVVAWMVRSGMRHRRLAH